MSGNMACKVNLKGLNNDVVSWRFFGQPLVVAMRAHEQAAVAARPRHAVFQTACRNEPTASLRGGGHRRRRVTVCPQLL